MDAGTQLTLSFLLSHKDYGKVLPTFTVDLSS